MVTDSANTDRNATSGDVAGLQNATSGDVAGLQTFSVHLQSLQSFGQELQTQLDGLRQPLDRLSQLLRRELPLGSFGEAYSLSGHHLSMAGQMYSLLQAVRQAVEFSGQVTGQVVASYQQYDQQAATALADPSAANPTIANLPVHLPVTVTVQSFTYSDPANANLSGG